MDIHFTLKEYGLSEKEIVVYTELLPLGCVNLQEIGRRVDLPRSTIYNTLNYLSSKGLVSTIQKKGVTFFQATEPKKLVNIIDQKRALLLTALPELEALHNSIKESSSVEIYEGPKGLFTILSDVFKKRQQTHYFGSYSLSIEILKHQPEHFRNLRLERKIPAKVIIDPVDDKIFHTKEYTKITEMRFLPELKDFPCMIFIYGNKVAIYTLKKDLVGVIIKNKQVAIAMKMIFDIYWNKAKTRA